MLLKLEGVDTEEAAREFSNRDVYYPLDLVDEDELLGDMTWDNFIGFTVIDEKPASWGKSLMWMNRRSMSCCKSITRVKSCCCRQPKSW